MPKKNLDTFKSEHPYCCFCGGSAATETRDEVPPKTLFFKRDWPEGYQFPACMNCNQSSRLVDQALGLIGRMSIADVHSEEESLLPHVKGVANNSPHLLPRTSKSAIEAKKTLRELGIRKPTGMFAQDVPIALLPAEAMSELDTFFAKLFCALYYKHIGKVVPNQSNVLINRTTNQILDSDNPFDWQMIPGVTNRSVIKRSGRSLHDQFDYNWFFDPDEQAFGFNFHIRYSLFGLMVGPVTAEVAADFPSDAKLKTGRPSA